MTDLTTFTTAVLLALLVYTINNLVRYLRAADWGSVLGVLFAWAGGLLVAVIAAHAGITQNLVLIKDAGPVGSLDFMSLLVLGLGLGSSASAFNDHLAAKDGTRSSAKPRLVGGPSPDINENG